MLRPGDKLPEFALKAATREGYVDVHTSDLLGRRTVIAFYPLASSGTCTEQLCDMRDALHGLEALDAQVYGFSIDSHFANRAFARAQNLPFPLLSDPNRDVVHRIWETQTVVGIRECPKRGVLVLDAHGVVRHVWVTDDPDEWVGVGAVKAALSA